MTVSYNWLSEYLPVSIEPERLSKILTSIGLEVESFTEFESVKGGLAGLVIGEVLTSDKHPNADKLKLTTVNVGGETPLQIVCGAANVAAGQKVVVAPVGATIYPVKGEPVTMRVAKIRGIESYGMICAEDEIGVSDDHSGIMVLDTDLKAGTAAAEYFKPFKDWIYEIGLTPNRMDAMSHLGIARDVCAYLTHHDRGEFKPRSPLNQSFKPGSNSLPVSVSIENKNACQRYSGVSIANVSVKPSPEWLQQKLVAIGQRPINNIVDITNFILHETGQPLHAFDLDKIRNQSIIVTNLPDGTKFISLDEKERSLNKEDLMICNGDREGMCIAGVFGGLNSGVSPSTRNIFLESAWFNPIDIRKTAFRHNLRTEAAARFEKNIDISNTVNVLKRAASLIAELAGGTIASEIVDVYPQPKPKTEVTLKYHYLKKLSGKNFHPDTVKKILLSLGFEIVKEGLDDIRVAVPFHKPDISLPADIVEEVMRIDGYDNIEIPTSITISPSVQQDGHRFTYTEKLSNYLVGLGFNEIFTNSITNAAYFDDEDLKSGVRLLNNLSAVHNIMRPSMLETGLEAVAYNLNRKNIDLKFFEFGKTYSTSGPGQYSEANHVCAYITGRTSESSWKSQGVNADIYYVKGLVNRIGQLLGLDQLSWRKTESVKLVQSAELLSGNEVIAVIGSVSKKELERFDIKQEVFFADINWELALEKVKRTKVAFRELPKQLPVYRDLAMVIARNLPFEKVESTVRNAGLERLNEVKLFDVFESDKLGADKKSIALSFTFLDEEKTMTDKEIDAMMNTIMKKLEDELSAEIRKG